MICPRGLDYGRIIRIVEPQYNRASCFPKIRQIWIDIRSFFRSKCATKDNNDDCDNEKLAIDQPSKAASIQDIDAMVANFKVEEAEKAKATAEWEKLQK